MANPDLDQHMYPCDTQKAIHILNILAEKIGLETGWNQRIHAHYYWTIIGDRNWCLDYTVYKNNNKPYTNITLLVFEPPTWEEYILHYMNDNPSADRNTYYYTHYITESDIQIGSKSTIIFDYKTQIGLPDGKCGKPRRGKITIVV